MARLLGAPLQIYEGGTGAIDQPTALGNVLGTSVIPQQNGGTGVTNVTALSPLNNLLMNGSFLISQRYGAYGTLVVFGVGSKQYVYDKWFIEQNGPGRIDTYFQGTDFPPNTSETTVGNIFVGLTDSSLGTNKFYQFTQGVEGYLFSNSYFGSAAAKTLTISFWIKSTLSGTFPIAFRNSAGNRSLVNTINIPTPNTWQRFFLTLPGDTSGAWLTDNNAGIFFSFILGAGSNFVTSSLNTWLSGDFRTTSGATNAVASNTRFLISQVKLEVTSPTATLGTSVDNSSPYQLIPFDMELERVQRYSETSYNYGIGVSNLGGPSSGTDITFGQVIDGGAHSDPTQMLSSFKKTKRATPAMYWFSPFNGQVNRIRDESANTNITVNSSVGTGQSMTGYPNTATSTGTGHVYSGHWLAEADF